MSSASETKSLVSVHHGASIETQLSASTEAPSSPPPPLPQTQTSLYLPIMCSFFLQADPVSEQAAWDLKRLIR